MNNTLKIKKDLAHINKNITKMMKIITVLKKDIDFFDIEINIKLLLIIHENIHTQYILLNRVSKTVRMNYPQEFTNVKNKIIKCMNIIKKIIDNKLKKLKKQFKFNFNVVKTKQYKQQFLYPLKFFEPVEFIYLINKF
jgi:hypothetical protein